MQNYPSHIAIIMDGNGRWAENKNMPRTYGHKKGVETLKEIVKAFIEFEIPSLTVYAFSTENWKRPPKEVKYLMSLFSKTIENEAEELNQQDVKINIIGRRNDLDEKILKNIEWIEKLTENNKRLELNIAFNYGGRAEIVDSAKKIIDSKMKAKNLNEEKFSSNLYLNDMPDVEFLIRTGGEKRLSNFLLWELAYAELYFTDVFWPDFTKENLERAIKEFKNRNRRFGSLNEDGGYNAF